MKNQHNRLPASSLTLTSLKFLSSARIGRSKTLRQLRNHFWIFQYLSEFSSRRKSEFQILPTSLLKRFHALKPKCRSILTLRLAQSDRDNMDVSEDKMEPGTTMPKSGRKLQTIWIFLRLKSSQLPFLFSPELISFRLC